MKKLIIISFLILFASCSSKKEFNEKSIQLNNEASEKIRTEDYVSALNLLNESIKLDSSYYTAYDNKIVLLLQLNKYDEAIKTNKLLLNHEPDLAESHFFLGMLYDIQGDSIKAIHSYKNAIRIYKNRITKGKMVEANELNLALAYKLVGDKEQANKLFNKLMIDSKDKKMIESFNNSSKANVLLQLFQQKK